MAQLAIKTNEDEEFLQPCNNYYKIDLIHPRLI